MMILTGGKAGETDPTELRGKLIAASAEPG